VKRYGEKSSYKGTKERTLLLVDIKDISGATVTDHLWMKVGKRLSSLAALPGDRVQFDARVTEYVKGYRKSGARDYRLSFPTKVQVVQRCQHAPVMASRPIAPANAWEAWIEAIDEQ
jgi:hypothetical protein